MNAAETIFEVVEAETAILKHQECNQAQIKININWKDEYFFMQPTIDEMSPQTSEVYVFNTKNEDKDKFLRLIIEKLKRFALANFQLGIALHDLENNDAKIFESKSCETFLDKVLQLTALPILRISSVIMKDLDTEIYFFVLPQTSPVESVIVTADYPNSSAVNSLMIKLTYAAQQNDLGDTFENVNFYGKIKNDSHIHLKRCISAVTDLLINKLLRAIKMAKTLENEKREVRASNSIVDSVIDLVGTETDETDAISRSIAFSIITSFVLECDPPLNSFYDPVIMGLRKGWDAVATLEQAKNNLYDDFLFNQWLSELHTNPDEDLCREMKQLQLYEKEQQDILNLTPKLNKGIETGIQIEAKIERPTQVKKEIKSLLFSPEQTKSWLNSRSFKREKSPSVEDLKKREFSKSYTIPKIYALETYSGPQCRPPIHRQNHPEKVERVMNRLISNLNDSDTPGKNHYTSRINSCHRSSITQFLNRAENHSNHSESIDLDPEDDECSIVSGPEPKKGKLQPLAETKKFFKSRNKH